MLFSAKQKGFFVEYSPDAVFIARTSSMDSPMVVEEVRECPAGDAKALEDAIAQLQPKKSPSGFLHATCGIYPAKRLVRRVTLELKRLKDPEYFTEVITQQLRVDPEKYTTVVLNASDGSDFDVTRPSPQKDVLFGGMANEAIQETQNSLLEDGFFPERLEIGSLSSLGALVSYLAQKNDKTPTLVLEVGADVTHSYIVTSAGVEASRPIPQGFESMVPVVQKELGLKDEESARKLFFSNTFDFTGMGPTLIKKLMKELQSSIGFYEVQTGQSVGLLHTMLLPPKLAWLNTALANGLGVGSLEIDFTAWLGSRNVTLSESVQSSIDTRWFGLCSLMINHNAVTTETDAVAQKED